MTIHAVYENGVFRPTENVELPDRREVEVEIRTVNGEPRIPTLGGEWRGRAYNQKSSSRL